MMNGFYINVDVVVKDSFVLIATEDGVDTIPRYIEAAPNFEYIDFSNAMVAMLVIIALFFMAFLLLKTTMR
jgi:hypothetical protein